jgi:hypothetical protein
MSTQEDPLANTLLLIAEAYSAFNRRDIDGALALMSENMSWPTGGPVHPIRAEGLRRLSVPSSYSC